MLPRPGLTETNFNEDLAIVHEAARRLRVAPFDLFRVAYRTWYGGEPNETALEHMFFDCLYGREAPPWLRHFCREVLAGNVRDAEGVPRRMPVAEPSRPVVALMIAIAFAVYITILGVGHAGPAAPLG